MCHPDTRLLIDDDRRTCNEAEVSGSRSVLVSVVGEHIDDGQELDCSSTTSQQLFNPGAGIGGSAGSRNPSENSPDLPALIKQFNKTISGRSKGKTNRLRTPKKDDDVVTVDPHGN